MRKCSSKKVSADSSKTVDCYIYYHLILQILLENLAIHTLISNFTKISTH
jgi:hypothetical protein